MRHLHPYTFILDGNGTNLNRGCEAILRSTLTILTQTFGRIRIVYSPIGTDPNHNLITGAGCTPLRVPPQNTSLFSRMQKRAQRLLGGKDKPPFYSHIDNASAILSLGGDNFGLDYGIPERHFNAFDAAISKGKPFVIWGASIGPFSQKPILEAEYMRKLQRAALICARETTTQQYLAAHGVAENVRLVADPAFILESQPAVLPKEHQEALTAGCIGINLSPLLGRFVTNGTPWPELAGELVRAMDSIVDQPLLLVPHVYKPHNNDLDFMKDMLASLGPLRNPVHLLTQHYNACELKWIIGHLNAFVGARTHATIAALSSCVPTISLGYSTKSQGINKDIYGHLDWLTQATTLSSTAFSCMFAEFMRQLPSIRNQLRATVPAYREQSWNNGKFLKAVLEAHLQ